MTVDIDKQSKLREFVNRHVIYCLSTLVYELSQNEKYMEDLLPVMSKDNWESPAQDYIREMSREDCIDYLEDGSIQYKDKDTLETLREAVTSDLQEKDASQGFCEDNRLDPYTDEALEHWLVSDWLARKLEAKGEMILKGFMGLTIWGRCCSGQSIILDSVIEEIYDETNM